MSDVLSSPTRLAWVQEQPEYAKRYEHDHLERLARYRDLILEWNQRFNLTAMRDAREIDYRLILDSLRFWNLARDHLRIDLAGASSTLIDIGSGAGIPGIPIAIVEPNVRVTMVEATGKKARFIQTSIDFLGVTNATVVHARAEDLARDPRYRESFDVAIARAVGSTATLLELATPFLVPGGQLFFPKGTLDEREIGGMHFAAGEVGAVIEHIVAAPHVNGCPDTQVVIGSRIGSIPDRFPRRAGTPARDPLGG
jgi:16S rRNA (guanine527-N7)-methyltransferase